MDTILLLEYLNPATLGWLLAKVAIRLSILAVLGWLLAKAASDSTNQ
jgi:hypothetical protein